MLTFGAIQQAQAGMNREQLAQTAQAATVQPALVPPPAVVSSAPAKTATMNNFNTLRQSEQLFSQPAPDPLQQVYSKRSDLQSLYDPQGQAKNVNDPRVAGIPTLEDWAKKFGANEEPLLRGAYVQPGANNNPAQARIVDRVNGLLKQIQSSGQPLSDEDNAYLMAINELSTGELNNLSAARSAADDKDYTTLNTIMGELSEIRKNRDKLLSDLYSRMNQTAEEVRLTNEINAISQKEQNLDLQTEAGLNDLGNQQIAAKFIQGDQLNLLKQANLKLKTLAAQKAPLISQLQLASQTRQDQMEAIKTQLLANGDDQELVFQLGTLARELQQTQKQEQKAAKDFATENQIAQPFYIIGGTVYRTADGKPYSTPEQAAKDGVDIASWANVEQVEGNAKIEKGLVLQYIEKYPDANILPTDTLQVAQQKLSSSRIYAQQTRLADGTDNDSSSGVSSEIESYAQGVYSGTINITGVPQKLRDEVLTRVEELKSGASNKHNTEFEARVDYDRDIQALAADLRNGEQLPPVSEIINMLVNDYGSKISKQEIQSTIYNLFGVQQPQQQQSTTATTITPTTKTYITTSQGAKQQQQQATIEQKKQRAQDLINIIKTSKDSGERARARNELNMIPMKLNGVVIHNGV